MKLFGKKKSDDPIEAILDGCDVLRFPQATLRILERLRDSDSSMEDVAEALQWDPGLVVKLLGTVNSAAFSPAQQIHDVRHAASYLGRSQVEQIVLALAVKDTLPRKAAQGFDAPRFWYAAASRAALASAIANELHPAQRAISFTCGMLQDMAIPVLANGHAEKYGPVLECWHANKDANLADLEQASLGWSHDAVGSRLARRWDLPDDLIAGIERHHSDAATDQELPPALRLVSVLRETHPEFGLECMIETARSDYGLTPDWTREAVEQSEGHARDLAALLS